MSEVDFTPAEIKKSVKEYRDLKSKFDQGLLHSIERDWVKKISRSVETIKANSEMAKELGGGWLAVLRLVALTDQL